MASNLYIGLVHYPIYDKRKRVVATAVTNFDIHDIARCARTFGAGGFFVITPLDSQIHLVERLIHHWVVGGGSTYNPTRKESLSIVRISRTIDEAGREISGFWQRKAQRSGQGDARHDL